MTTIATNEYKVLVERYRHGMRTEALGFADRCEVAYLAIRDPHKSPEELKSYKQFAADVGQSPSTVVSQSGYYQNWIDFGGDEAGVPRDVLHKVQAATARAWVLAIFRLHAEGRLDLASLPSALTVYKYLSIAKGLVPDEPTEEQRMDAILRARAGERPAKKDLSTQVKLDKMKKHMGAHRDSLILLGMEHGVDATPVAEATKLLIKFIEEIEYSLS